MVVSLTTVASVVACGEGAERRYPCPADWREFEGEFEGVEFSVCHRPTDSPTLTYPTASKALLDFDGAGFWIEVWPDTTVGHCREASMHTQPGVVALATGAVPACYFEIGPGSHWITFELDGPTRIMAAWGGDPWNLFEALYTLEVKVGQ